MLDKFWKGVDSSYIFLHLKCGNEFDAVYDQVRSSVRSCTSCHKKVRIYLNWKKAKKSIEEQTENRYTLDRTDMHTSGERSNYRYIKCNIAGCMSLQRTYMCSLSELLHIRSHLYFGLGLTV